MLAPTTAARLAREGKPLGDPWPDDARDLFVRLLAAGPGLLGVWETLDETGALERVLPEWERVRLLPHASVVHRFTVDRHLVETCIEASSLIRRVARPDVLMVAALLHDIGKGQLTEHCVAGEPIARAIAVRIGFDEREADLIAALVRWHLLLPETATTRDPDDPATVETVTKRVTDREELELLAALTEADAKATSEKAWTAWRASLVRTLVRRTEAALDDEPVPDERGARGRRPRRTCRPIPRAVSVQVDDRPDGSRVTVVSGDRIGLLADAAAVLALQKVSVRAARAWTQDQFGCSVWEVAETGLDEVLLRQRLEAIVEGRLDAAARLSRVDPGQAGADGRRTPGGLADGHRARGALERPARAGAHRVRRPRRRRRSRCARPTSSTLGPQAVDVFYVQEQSAGALSEERAASAAHAVREALLRTYTDPNSG